MRINNKLQNEVIIKKKLTNQNEVTIYPAELILCQEKFFLFDTLASHFSHLCLVKKIMSFNKFNLCY